MIIRIQDESQLILREPNDLRSFKIVVGSEQDLAPFRQAGGAVEVAGAREAWVERAWIVQQSGMGTSEAWMAQFEQMVRYADSKGWVRHSDGAILGHIEFEGS